MPLIFGSPSIFFHSSFTSCLVILIDLLYDKPNSKGVVWDMCGDVIIDNLLSKSGGIIEYPEVVDADEEFGCCRKKFRMKQLTVGGANNGKI